MQLQLTDGTTTITLSGTAPVVGCTYFPDTPVRRNGAYSDVTESAEIVLSGAPATIRSTVNSIELLLEAAARRTAGVVQVPVYVHYKPVDADTAYRSEVIEGRLVWSPNPGLRRLGSTSTTTKVVIFWRRKYYWEGTTETELQLSTSNQSAASGGRAILNHDDAGTGHDNWVQIAAAQVGGTLPSGCIVAVTNTIGSARTWRRFYIGHNALSDPANFPHILEGEDRTSGGTVTVDAASSAGNYLAFTLAASTVTFSWTLTAAMMQDTQGRLLRVLMVVNAATTASGTAQAEIRTAPATVAIWKGSIVPMASAPGIVDLGALPFPPGGYSSIYDQLRLSVTITGTGTWGIDFLQLTPMDGLMFLQNVYAVANNEAIVVNSIEGNSYVATTTTRIPYVAASGTEILLHPNTLQRLYVLTESVEVAPAIADSYSVRVYYRPRRLVV